MYKLVTKESFAIIGKECPAEGTINPAKYAWKNIIKDLREVEDIILKESDGSIRGIWGFMDSYREDLTPYSDSFYKGTYLAGFEADVNAIPPKGWVKRIIKKQMYFVVKIEREKDYVSSFFATLNVDIPYDRYCLDGAVLDYVDTKTREKHLFFPVKKQETVIYSETKTDKIAPCGSHCAYCSLNQNGICENQNNFCSCAKTGADDNCDIVLCNKRNKTKGCYQCDKLMSCKKGVLYIDKCSKASSIFIFLEGKEVFEKALKNAIKAGLNYPKDFILDNNINRQVKLLYKYKK